MTTSKKKKVTGMTVYQDLMNLDVLLQDIEEMLPLRFFLSSTTPDNGALLELQADILRFTERIRLLAGAGKR